MLVIGLILNVFGIGLFCWLIFTLAVYALPFFIALTASMGAFHSGAGVLGVVTGNVTLAIGQIAFAIVRLPVLRAVIAAAFAVPAAIAGYHAVLGLSQIGVPSLVWARGVRLDGRALHWRHGLGADDGVRGALSVEADRSITEQLSAASYWRGTTGLGLHRPRQRVAGDRALTFHMPRSLSSSSLRRCAALKRLRSIAHRLIGVESVAERLFGNKQTRLFLRHGFFLCA
jgi:hypothetical protein